MSEDTEQKKDSFAEDSERAIKLQSSRRFQLVSAYGEILGERLYQKELRDAQKRASDKDLEDRKLKALGILAELEKEHEITDREQEILRQKAREFLAVEKEVKRVNGLLAYYKDVLEASAILVREIVKTPNTHKVILEFEKLSEKEYALTAVTREPQIDEKAIELRNKRGSEALERMHKDEKERKARVAKDKEKFEDDLKRGDEILRSLRNERIKKSEKKVIK